MSGDSKWMDGGFFVVMHTKYDSGVMGKGVGISFLGYDTDEKKYTYNEFNSQGEAIASKGTVYGDTWTWIGDVKMGQPMRSAPLRKYCRQNPTHTNLRLRPIARNGRCSWTENAPRQSKLNQKTGAGGGLIYRR